MYKAEFHPAFPKDLKRMPKTLILKVQDLVESIKVNPEIGEKLQADLAGYYSYHLKFGGVDYRLGYTLYNDVIYFLMFKTQENYYD